MKTTQIFSIVVVFALFSLIGGAADWTQFRGPQRSGASQEKGLLQEWPKEGPKLLWQIKDIGEGYGTPAVTRAADLSGQQHRIG